MTRPRRVPGRHLVVIGPTASGKSALALELAERRRRAGELVEIVSADSMAVYRGMDIGTTTPDAADRARVPHHLIDLVEPHEEFSVAQYRAAADVVLDDLEARGGAAVLVGGTGLYVQALVDDLELPGRFPSVVEELEREDDTRKLHRRLADVDPLAASRIEPDNRRRTIRALEVTIGSGRRFSSYGPGLEAHPPTPFVQVGLRTDRALLAERVVERLDAQMEAGFLDEVRRLLEGPEPLSRTASQALGYRELIAHLHGTCTLDEALGVIAARTRRLGVRQIRWFRRDPRIEWFDADGDPRSALGAIDARWARNPIGDPDRRPLR